ncbi:MAG: glycosyltransferase family 4 protein [Acidobacteriota bacterium]|nr:glycosyltransferase family 4 protein [Acidobacteriota bacterium]
MDATYSLGEDLSGVGIYSRELLNGLAGAHPERGWLYYYRPHRFLRSFQSDIPRNAHRRLLLERSGRPAALFHGLNQRLPRRRFGKQIATFHDLFVLTGDYSTGEFRRRFADQARHAAAEADRIIAVSAFTAHQVETLLDVDPARIRVIHHGVRALTVHPPAREKIILSVGAIQARKNIARLVQAFESAPPDWTLVLAGSHGFGSDAILRRIEKSPRRSQIRLTGYVTSAELARWYARATIFAFPSLDEGFGMPVLEAMAAGVPVVSSNRSALPEVCGNAALLASPDNVDEIAECLNRVIQDDALRETLIERGKQRAAEFTWRKAANATWDVYSELSAF